MPVYDLSYRHWHGALLPRSQRWLTIAVARLGPLFKKRSFLFWMVLCWIPALIAGVLVWVIVNFGSSSDLPFDASPGTFHSFFFNPVLLYVYVLTSAFVGAGLIANDRRTNALQIYLSKPLLRRDYLLGKAATIGAVLGIVTLGPPFAVYLLRVGLDKQSGYFTSHLTLPFSLLGAALLITVTMTILALTVSSFARSGRTAGVSLVMLYLFTDALQGTLWLFRQRWTYLMFPIPNLKQVLDWIFGQVPHYGLHPIWSVVALAVFLAACIYLLVGRVRPIEVIS